MFPDLVVSQKEHPFYLYADLYYPYDFDCKYQKFTEEHFLLDESISRAISLSTATQSAKELVPLFVDLYQREVDGEDFVPALKAIISKNGLESYPFNKVKIEDFLGDEEGCFNSLTTMNR